MRLIKLCREFVSSFGRITLQVKSVLNINLTSPSEEVDVNIRVGFELWSLSHQKTGATRQNRTGDLLITNQLLYQLS
jgi:hypothetical protein